MVQKYRVNSFTHRVIAAKAKRHVGHATRDFSAGQILFNPAGGVDKVDGVVVVLFDTGGDGEDVGIKNNVFRREVDFVDQQAISALANLNLARIGIGLAFLVKRHHHRSRAVALEQFGLLAKDRLAFFHGDGINNSLALNAAQTGFNHAPLRAVDHDGHAGNVGLAGDQIQKAHHRGLAVQHGFVHVDVYDLRAVFDLLTGHD